jgi:hypothetical protein
MLSTTPTLSLTHEQASRLQAYLQTYRRYSFGFLLPSVNRNTINRLLQTLQGKLIALLDQGIALARLLLTTEEMSALKASIAELLLLYAKKPASAARNAILVDLAALKSCLKRV